ncbi:hypothetical protein N7471_005669 [Penicillium samsonianum]|uniref:uncharacterized protein n=1 Tax=Penicillium samsonianum TaxID=1882272 RepID=UPI00254835D5|nr:uncharacterized protein N7471_005669 [Penicillium samsonianum]KAJ6139183.1 hypothetical protein N7471_005669 [Penicillium samsonianum]
MSLSNLAPLDSRTIPTIQAACRFFGYLHANPRWSLKITPDEVELIYFIVLNYSELGQTSTSSSIVSIPTPQNLASTQFDFPKTWLTQRKRVLRAARVFLIDAKRIFFMTDGFHHWRRQLFTTSLLDLPNELLQLIAALLPTKTLAGLCQLNRHLSNVIGFELWRPLDRVLVALKWSLDHRQLVVYTKAVEVLSKIPESMGNKSTWKLFPVINTDNIHMLECMALKGGFSGKLYRQFLVDTLLYNVEWSNPKHLSVEEVLKLGADPNCFSHDPALCSLNLGRIPILLIAICGSRDLCVDIFERLPQHPYNTYFPKRSTVHIVHLLLEYGADPNAHISDNTSPLHVAVSPCNFMRKSDVVTELIKYGANANAIGPHGKTPLHVAVAQNHCSDHRVSRKDTIDAHLQAPGIDLDPRDENGRTPLSIAAGLNSAASAWFVKKMLENPNVDINSQDLHGKTVLYHSVESKNIRVAKLLLSQSHINPNLNTKYLPLFFAVSRRMLPMVESLLSTKATDPNRKDSNGRLALTLPTSKAIIKLLIEAGAELDIPDSTGLTARETILQAGINIEQVMHASRKRKRERKS